MNERTESKQIDISFLISKYLIPVFERKWMVVSFFLTATLLSIFASNFVHPEFYSTASLLIEEPQSQITSRDMGNILRPKNAGQTYVLGQAEMLKSAQFLAEVLSILPSEAKQDIEIDLELFPQIMEGFKKLVKGVLGERLILWIKRLKMKGKIEPIISFSIKNRRIGQLKKRMMVKTKSKNAMIWITARATNGDVATIMLKSYIAAWMAVNLEENKNAIMIKKKVTENEKNNVCRDLLETKKKLLDFKKHYEIPSSLNQTTDIGDMEIQLQMERLQSQVKTVKDRFDYLDKAYLQIQIQEAGIQENIKLLEAPTMGIPSGNNKGNILLVGIFGGLVLGIAIAVGLDFIKMPIRHRNDIIDAVDIAILGDIPLISDNKGPATGNWLFRGLWTKVMARKSF